MVMGQKIIEILLRTKAKGVNKGKVGIYRLVDNIYNDNLQNKTLPVCENGSNR